MRRHLLQFPVVFLTFTAALALTPYDAASGLRGVFNRIVSLSERAASRPAALADYYGYWGGSGRDVIELRADRISDAENGRSYKYRVVRYYSYPDGGKACLLEVSGIEPGSNLRKYIYLGLNETRIDYFGYTDWDDFYVGRASASVSLWRSSYR